ncbi:MAG: hypothetical protein M3011_13795 [Actinomycetota bacterium]|nr:hypothetical protein [Actinomycetota bacterium]
MGPLSRSRLLLVAIVLALYLSSPNVTNTDAYLAVPTAVSIVHSADLDLDEFSSSVVRNHYGFSEVDGRHYDRFPWAEAVLFVPGVLILDGLAHLGVGNGAAEMVETNSMGPLQLATASLVAALAALVVAALAYDRLRVPLRARRRAAFAVALIFALGTAAWSTASRSLWQHGPSMLALGLALLAATRLEDSFRPRVMAVVLGASLGAAYALRPTNAIAIIAFTVFVGLRHRQHAIGYLCGLGAVLGVFVAVNVGTYGRVLPRYYSGSRVSVHAADLEALAANLVSPARGILVFSPIVVLSGAGVVITMRRRSLHPLDAVAAVCVVAQVMVVSAQNEGWWAGHAFGPRFLRDVLPLLAYLSSGRTGAARRDERPEGGPISQGRTGCGGDRGDGERRRQRRGCIPAGVHMLDVDPVDVDLDPSRVWDLRHPQVLAGIQVLVDESPRRAMWGPCDSQRAAPGDDTSG